MLDPVRRCFNRFIAKNILMLITKSIVKGIRPKIVSDLKLKLVLDLKLNNPTLNEYLIKKVLETDTVFEKFLVLV